MPTTLQTLRCVLCTNLLLCIVGSSVEISRRAQLNPWQAHTQGSTTIIQRQKCNSPVSFLLACSCIQLYNEQIFDLLNPASGPLNLRESTEEGGLWRPCNVLPLAARGILFSIHHKYMCFGQHNVVASRVGPCVLVLLRANCPEPLRQRATVCTLSCFLICQQISSTCTAAQIIHFSNT